MQNVAGLVLLGKKMKIKGRFLDLFRKANTEFGVFFWIKVQLRRPVWSYTGMVELNWIKVQMQFNRVTVVGIGFGSSDSTLPEKVLFSCSKTLSALFKLTSVGN